MAMAFPTPSRLATRTRSRVLLGLGTGDFAPAVSASVGTFPTMALVADLNGDGMLDVVTTNSNSNDISVLLGNGAGGFGAATIPELDWLQ